MYLWNIITGGKVVYQDTLFFATGFLYAATDMKDITEIPFPDSERVSDLLQDDTGVYALCNRHNESGDYTISVWKNSAESLQDFKEIQQFNYPIPAMSFTMDKNHFYFGMGEREGSSALNGMVLRAKFTN